MSKMWALVGSNPLLDIISPLATGLPSMFGFGALTFSLPTSFKCQRWFASSRRSSRMASASLRFPLHPFIKSVLQYFNVCSAQLSPNFWGVLVGLLVVFRDKGLGVPSITLLLYFFSVKESAEGFLYIAKRSNAKLIILDLPPSHKHWKERYFFVGGRNREYNSADREDTLSIPIA